jgi:restriction system protein
MLMPKFNEYILPVLRYLTDEREHTLAEVRQAMIAKFRLSPEVMAQKLGSGKQSKVDNRIGWAVTYSVKAGLIERCGYAKIRLTSRGADFLINPPPVVTIGHLEAFPEFRDFKAKLNNPGSRTRSQKPKVVAPIKETEPTDGELVSFQAGQQTFKMSVKDMARLMRELQTT